MKKNIIICNNIYGIYIVPETHNRPVINHLRKGIPFEPDTIKFIRDNHKGAIVTAGTYIGDFLPAFCDIPKVYAFEPVSENYKYALVNKILNDLHNITLENLCLSDSNTKLKMLTIDNNILLGGSSNVCNKNFVETLKQKTEEVNSIKLDDYLIKNEMEISIIQLDVENHETEVLSGAIKTIEKYKPIIIVETKPLKHIENILFEFGYKYHKKKLHANYILFISSKHKLIF